VFVNDAFAIAKGKEEVHVSEVINLDHKRVCDVSADARIIEIRRKDCVTRITANPNGTLKISHERIEKKV
jgi:hypothetical protein